MRPFQNDFETVSFAYNDIDKHYIKNLKTNITAKIYIAGDSFLKFPQHKFSNT